MTSGKNQKWKTISELKTKEEHKSPDFMENMVREIKDEKLKSEKNMKVFQRKK